nr:HAMP domain-containing sensor histidine kinase [Pseudonocardia lacus]
MVRLSLRWRVALALGLGTVVLAGVLAVVTWNLASGYMLRQRETSAIRQAEVNVQLVDASLRTGSEGLGDLLSGLTSSSDATILIERPSGWLTSGRQVDADVLPPALLRMATDGVPAHQRLNAQGIPVLAVTLPVDGGESAYVELFPLTQLDQAFRFLSTVLAIGVAASGLLGLGLGHWAGRRALRPLTELTQAAARVVGGDLRARLPDRDDPDLASLAATFNRTADALEKRVRRDARFAGDVSHELRSPLTTMANAGAVLRRRRDELTGTAGRALDLLLGEIGRFQRMVVDLLEISRDDLRPDEVPDEVVDLGDVVRHVVAVRPGKPPEVDLVAQPPLVLADRRRLDRTVANLLDNADKYAGGAVRVAVLRHGGRARLEVDDSGPGVPDDQREQIFERFARGPYAGRRGVDGGSGLGLALVAQDVRWHGGAVRVEDRPGGGARFVVELPEVHR